MESVRKVEFGPISEAPPANVSMSLSHINPQQPPVQCQKGYLDQQQYLSQPMFYPQCYSSANGFQQQQQQYQQQQQMPAMPMVMQQQQPQRPSTNSCMKTYIIVEIISGIVVGTAILIFMLWKFAKK